jgi:hypothetical protein
VLIGDAGRDRMLGGRDRDIFVIQRTKGFAIIGDFRKGQDRIGLADGLTFSDLTIAPRGSGTVIRVGTERLAIVENVNPTVFAFNDFVFV